MASLLLFRYPLLSDTSLVKLSLRFGNNNRCSNCFSRRWTYTRVVSSLSESVSAVCTDNEINRDRRLTWVCPKTPVNSNTRWNSTQHIMKNRHLNYTNQFHWTHTLHSHLISRNCFPNVYVPHVGLHTSGSKEEEEKSVMEKAVSSLKERKQEKAFKQLVDPITQKSKEVTELKPSIVTTLKDMLVHYYHGFRLFFLDMKVSSRLLYKSLKGESLSRREQKQFRRTAGDLFRILPFSVFIIIPFMEFLLPVYLWVFPNALPSTFQKKSSYDARKKKELKVKLQMAKFLQDTLQEMAVSSRNPKKKKAVQEFAEFFDRIRTSGTQADTEEIMKFSKLFENELTLTNLSHKQLQALCRLVLLPTIGSSNVLRLQLRMKLRQIKSDDEMIKKEGIKSLTVQELQSACQARGMRALGMPQERLKSQLTQWLDLHLNKQIPASLLLLSRALYLPEDIPTSDVLKQTLSKLPETIVDEAEVLVASTVGESVDNRRRVDVIRQQEILIREEEREKMERHRERLEKEMRKEGQVTTKAYATPTQPLTTPIDIIKTTPINQMTTESESFSPKDIRDLSEVVSSLKPMLEEEREVLREIQEDREEYREDIADLAQECSEGEEKLEESIASERLGRRVEAMLSKVDKTLSNLERDFVTRDEGDDIVPGLEKHQGELISVQQLENALTLLQGTSCEAKYRSLFSVLDEDHDGNINLEEMAEVIEALATEDTDINPEHIEQIKRLIKLENTDKNN